MKSISILSIVLLLLFVGEVQAQFVLDAELRPRTEYRHGFKTLFPDHADPAFFISQRTRLNADYRMEKLSFYLSVQDVRVWGDVPQLNAADKNGLGIHQAWAAIQLESDLSLKVGRQEISYDDHRIFGNVGWAQQARSHDAALLRYKKSNFALDLGFAYNQDSENLIGTTLPRTNTYKSLQYLWAHKEWGHFGGSFLFLNNGLQFMAPDNTDDTETRYSQTVGTHLNYTQGHLKLSSNLYYQFGKDVANNDLNAYLVSLEGQYQLTARWKWGLGGELLSGNEGGAPANGNNKAFNPLYGTNHKFNGHMDYFYVGEHLNNVGLLDLYLKTTIALNEKSSLEMALHNFSAAADIAPGTKKQLGNELDIIFTRKLQQYVTISAGYSHLFAAEGLEIVKGNTDGNTNNWGWIMLHINPTLFSSKP